MSSYKFFNKKNSEPTYILNHLRKNMSLSERRKYLKQQIQSGANLENVMEVFTLWEKPLREQQTSLFENSILIKLEIKRLKSKKVLSSHQILDEVISMHMNQECSGQYKTLMQEARKIYGEREINSLCKEIFNYTSLLEEKNEDECRANLSAELIWELFEESNKITSQAPMLN